MIHCYIFGRPRRCRLAGMQEPHLCGRCGQSEKMKAHNSHLTCWFTCKITLIITLTSTVLTTCRYHTIPWHSWVRSSPEMLQYFQGKILKHMTSSHTVIKVQLDDGRHINTVAAPCERWVCLIVCVYVYVPVPVCVLVSVCLSLCYCLFITCCCSLPHVDVPATSTFLLLLCCMGLVAVVRLWWKTSTTCADTERVGCCSRFLSLFLFWLLLWFLLW